MNIGFPFVFPSGANGFRVESKTKGSSGQSAPSAIELSLSGASAGSRRSPLVEARGSVARSLGRSVGAAGLLRSRLVVDHLGFIQPLLCDTSGNLPSFYFLFFGAGQLVFGRPLSVVSQKWSFPTALETTHCNMGWELSEQIGMWLEPERVQLGVKQPGFEVDDSGFIQPLL